jgi:N-methylhydantoinase B
MPAVTSQSTERDRPGPASPTRLKDLTDEDFERRYDCDRFTATILANRFRYVVSDMCNQLRTHAFSPIIRDSADMCGMLSGPEEMRFPMVAVSETLPLFYGSVPDGVRIVLEEYGIERLNYGDTLLVNDYYRVGTHLNDVCNIRPIFYQDALIGAVTIRAHMMDMGGLVPGGFEPTKSNVYQDGLRLPPILLYAAGEPVASTFNLIYDNTRLGNLIVPDLRTTYHALELGEQLLIDSIEKYGLDAYFGSMRYACDASEETMAQGLGALPDGIYEGEERIDGDGRPDSPEYVVRVRITKAGERAELDLRGSSRATQTAMNCAWPDVKTAVAMALKFLIDQNGVMTSGTLRNIDVVIPPDAIFNPAPPHACQFYFEVVMVIVYAIYQALNPILGSDAVTAGWLPGTKSTRGRRADGSEWNTRGTSPGVIGPWGATRHGDGDSGQIPPYTNMLMSGGFESFELENPLIVMASEYAPDSGGPGENRGGAASVHDIMCRLPASHHFQHFHGRRPTAGGGVYGGGDGTLTSSWLWDAADSEYGTNPPFLPIALEDPVYKRAIPQAGLTDPATNQPSRSGEYVHVGYHTETPPGAISRQLTSGGSGWGNPLQRDPQRVQQDVRDGYVTIEGAARDYGVVILGDPATDPEGLQVDEGGTNELRTARINAPGDQRSWPARPRP